VKALGQVMLEVDDGLGKGVHHVVVNAAGEGKQLRLVSILTQR
jgi:hypothetical protein